MARKKLKDIKFPDLPDTYFVPEIDATLSTEGAAADAKAVGDALDLKPDKTELEEAIADLDERKAEIDGYYETFTSGQTEQIIATEAITDTEPYIYRKTGGPNDVGDRVYDTLVGGSVVWNQLVASGATEVTVPNGHKYYANINGTKSIGASTGTAISINDSTKDNVIDLTAALTPTIADYIYTLETANAGDGVAWFRKYFPGIYYGYCEPHFEHVQTSAKATVGFNQWDEQWENGGIDENGNNVTASGRLRSKNHIPAFPETVYFMHIDSSIYPATWYGLFFYDGNKHFISTTTTSSADRTFTTPVGTRYIRFHLNDYWGGKAYTSGICINLHGDRDGEYEPYRKRTYPIEPKVLRGVPKLDSANRLYFDGDVYQHDGTVTRRYGIVDLGTLTYNKQGSTSEYPYGYFHCGIPGKKGGMTNFVVEGYTVVPTYGEQKGSVGDKTVAGSPGNTSVFFINAVYASYTVEQIKSAMSGVYLIYELATETTETAEPFQSPMVVDPLGTEEFVDYGVEQGTRDVSIVVGHSSEYPADLRGKLQHLPSLSASGDGRYVVVQTGNQMTLSPDTSLGLIAALEARVAALEGGN